MILNDINVSISDGTARNIGLIGASVVDARDDINSNSSLFAFYSDGKWGGLRIPFKIKSMSTLGTPSKHFLLLGENGEVSILGSGRDDTEQINREIRLPLTSIVRINDNIYAIGMGRQVYKRENENNWISLHKEMLLKGPPKLVGFQTIIEKKTHLYAAGWKGEIWCFNEGEWSEEKSPTNVILSSSTLTNDGKVLFCGQKGTIIIGETGSWEIVKSDLFLGDLLSTVNFQNKIYFSSNEGLFCLENKEVKEISIELDGYRRSHQKLSIVDDCLMSFGEYDILIYNGNEWSRIPTENKSPTE